MTSNGAESKKQCAKSKNQQAKSNEEQATSKNFSLCLSLLLKMSWKQKREVQNKEEFCFTTVLPQD